MKKSIILTLFTLFITMQMSAQIVVKLWEDNPPTNNGIMKSEETEGGLENVSDPEIIVYLPSKETNRKMAVIICPGGGYSWLAIDHEGHQFAKWLQNQGIVSVILKYRMPNEHKNVPLEDFHQAIRYVRSKASEWGIMNEKMQTKIGVAGFSAGGHLASTASTHYKTDELRPDFSILFYPVITMNNYTHEGSRANLLGKNASEDDILYFSNETRVDKDTPPTILLLSDDDKVVPSMNSIMYYESLKKYDIPSTMYIFPEGGHGWGMNNDFKYHNEMLSLLKIWLEQL